MALDDFTFARVMHVVAVLFWIGGVAFVTLVVLPAIRRGNPPAERLAAFRRIEAGFAPQARWWVLLALSLVAVIGAVGGAHGRV